MKIQEAVSLQTLTTMRLGGAAHLTADITTKEDIPRFYEFAKQHSLPTYILGGGSNVLARDEGFNGIVGKMMITGVELLEETDSFFSLRVGGGEVWDELCAFTTAKGSSSIAAMSAIPGTVGAAPVQNIGAYGQEAADVITKVHAYDSQRGEFVTLSAQQCDFSYRHSIFRGEASGRYCIYAVTMQFSKRPPQPPYYAALQTYLDEHAIEQPTPLQIREAVTAIRAQKLPDPALQPNTGSFFKNAIVDTETFTRLQQDIESVPHYPMPDGRIKVPTGWLIQQTGLKGELLHGMRVNPANALVLINESASSYSDLAAARQYIIDAVHKKFGITIEQEPLEIGPAA